MLLALCAVAVYLLAAMKHDVAAKMLDRPLQTAPLPEAVEHLKHRFAVQPRDVLLRELRQVNWPGQSCPPSRRTLYE